jgi:hypothetical protein
VQTWGIKGWSPDDTPLVRGKTTLPLWNFSNSKQKRSRSLKKNHRKNDHGWSVPRRYPLSEETHYHEQIRSKMFVLWKRTLIKNYWKSDREWAPHSIPQLSKETIESFPKLTFPQFNTPLFPGRFPNSIPHFSQEDSPRQPIAKKSLWLTNSIKNVRFMKVDVHLKLVKKYWKMSCWWSGLSSPDNIPLVPGRVIPGEKFVRLAILKMKTFVLWKRKTFWEIITKCKDLTFSSLNRIRNKNRGQKVSKNERERIEWKSWGKSPTDTM